MHKDKLEKVHNAVPGRDSTEIEIYGMEGIPEEDVIAHEKKGGQSQPPGKNVYSIATTSAQAPTFPLFKEAGNEFYNQDKLLMYMHYFLNNALLQLLARVLSLSFIVYVFIRICH